LLPARAAWRLGAEQAEDPRKVRETSGNTRLRIDPAESTRKLLGSSSVEVGRN
jgi:hypothetical protein